MKTQKQKIKHFTLQGMVSMALDDTKMLSNNCLTFKTIIYPTTAKQMENGHNIAHIQWRVASTTSISQAERC